MQNYRRVIGDIGISSGKSRSAPWLALQGLAGRVGRGQASSAQGKRQSLPSDGRLGLGKAQVLLMQGSGE